MAKPSRGRRSPPSGSGSSSRSRSDSGSESRSRSRSRSLSRSRSKSISSSSSPSRSASSRSRSPPPQRKSPTETARRTRASPPPAKRSSPPRRKPSPVRESLVLHIDALSRNVHEGHLREIFRLLNKHFEKLIQCDIRLNFLSQQPEKVLDSPYFERRVSIFEDPDHQAENSKGSTVSGLTDGASPSPQQSSLKIEQQDSTCTTVEHHSQEAPSPCSAEASAHFEVGSSRSSRNWEQMKVPGLHPSMSMNDLVNHIGHCITEQMTAANPSFANQGPEYQDILLDDIAQYLLNDNQSTTSDEKSLMKRVNSLCCLLQKDPTQNSQFNDEGSGEARDDKCEKVGNISRGDAKAFAEDVKDNSGTKQAVGMSRKDSFGELLMHLPRIASIPKFLFNISEDDES